MEPAEPYTEITGGTKTFAMKKLVDYVAADIKERLPQALEVFDSLDQQNLFLSKRKAAKDIIDDPDNNWNIFLQNLWRDIDADVLKAFLENVIVNGSINGLPKQQAASEEHDCNVPWAIFIEPTNVCNLECPDCPVASREASLDLSYAELDRTIEEAKDLGIHVFFFSGGEPLIRRSHIVLLCQRHDDCEFFVFTNGTLIDESFANECLRAKNLIPILNIEGFKATTDAKRGAGTFDSLRRAMSLLRERRLLFGVSCCFAGTSTEIVDNDEYADFLVDEGAKFAWFFSHSPLDMNTSLRFESVYSQQDRIHQRIHEWRKTKPIFTIDLVNDVSCASDCVVGSRAYCHINANGDIEPFAFARYSDSNIREKPLVEAFSSPLYIARKKEQPANTVSSSRL